MNITIKQGMTFNVIFNKHKSLCICVYDDYLYQGTCTRLIM